MTSAASPLRMLGAACLTNLTQSVSMLSHFLATLNLSHLRAVSRDVLPITLNSGQGHIYVDAMVAVSCPLNIGMTGGCRKTHAHRAGTHHHNITRICMPGGTPANFQSPKLVKRDFDRLYRFIDKVIRSSPPIYHPRIA
ncbi:hypothetical protein COCC4DRAFT_151177 [Bipolaris maydis ATCC 48331]|uniref:Uncharacterized protein n=2 Tax=Cochliobolus heterostrophus TaxID=5016 RepID=M2SIZ0_COCH5|nr:uncharacterized protein COCC4DRAFT_151177 [Bipolaris maydis ATCC 48331]EMD85315.1 hypothetical protein COCHEDRAFT_1161448 [Bipolaris maydis C5]ENI00149.1 hypothetical protein COCC4DRAFT_151177 [Bipolaris maydis ATCC 48331]